MTKIALYPIALLYGAIIWLRNKLFDWGFFASYSIPGKSICIGNIAVGGTGKSPHVAYLIASLSERFAIQVLSRGYGRKSKGFIEIKAGASSAQVGDEPLMLFEAFEAKAQFAVCENRRFGVQQLKTQKQDAILLLDDAFQHRWVKAGLQLVLTTYDKPFWKDQLLPLGRLREGAAGLARADALIVTKCPDFTSCDTDQIRSQLAYLNLPVFFSRYQMLPFKALSTPIQDLQQVVVVSAIAQPEQLLASITGPKVVGQKIFADHHAYTSHDIKEIHHFFDTFANKQTALVTTAKDWVKIRPLLSPEETQKYPWYLIAFELEWQDQAAFNQFISSYVDAN